MSQLDTDDLYPNQGDYFGITEPQDQVQERETEKAEVFSEGPQIQKVIDHFKERIAFRDSIKAVNPDIADTPELFQKVIIVNDMLADALREEKELLEGLLQDMDQ